MSRSRESDSAAQAWLRALQYSSSVPRYPKRTLAIAVDEIAAKTPAEPAILSDGQKLTYAQLARRQNQYARLALELGLEKGDVVCLLMENCPEYAALWIGMSSVGVVVALLNTRLRSQSIVHCIQAAQPKHVFVSVTLADTFLQATADAEIAARVWIIGGEHLGSCSLERQMESLSGTSLSDEERRGTSIYERALCIYTSGTTGLPKAANVSHARVMQWGQWFAGMLAMEASDRMYDCLPMYHSVGGVLAVSAVLMAGASVVVREKFSAEEFWEDIHRWGCTIFQYVGELCRYLLLATSPEQAEGHPLRVACGNGMSKAVWTEFVERFRIPRVLEFYASTEGGVSLFNVEGKPGAIGRVPPYLVHRYSPLIIRLNMETGEPLRDATGRCMECGVNEAGEALGRVESGPFSIGARYEGYTDAEASEKKVLRDVLSPGDAWVRTGDLLRRDEKGFYYFLDRIGDTFRWKGENISTQEVAEVMAKFPGIKHVNVYGVTVPGAEGRAGMASIVADGPVDLPRLKSYLQLHLPSYAQPVFVRFCKEMEVTATHKYAKAVLGREGYDPDATCDPIYYHDSMSGTYARLDRSLYKLIQSGGVRL